MKTMNVSWRIIQTCLLVLSLLGASNGLLSLPASAADTPAPATVTLVGSLQSELGCAGDWDPSCASTYLVYDAGDGVWQATFDLPAGAWEYKVALNNSWTENYGANATLGGANIALNLAAPTTVKFYYDHETHWVTSSATNVIATVPGNFQSELGCAGDWDPGCLRSWLQDPDGDGIYNFQTTALPAGNYEGKVAINEGWSENYGEGGAPGGANIAFTVPNDFDLVSFSYDPASHILTINVSAPPPSDSVALVGSLQSELGCAGDWDPACSATELAFVTPIVGQVAMVILTLATFGALITAALSRERPAQTQPASE